MKNVHETNAQRLSERRNTNRSIKQTKQKISVFYFLTTPTVRARATVSNRKIKQFSRSLFACKRTTNCNNRLIDRINPFGFNIVQNNFAVQTRPAPSAYDARVSVPGIHHPIFGPLERVRGPTLRLRLILAGPTVTRGQKQRHRILFYVENRSILRVF